jgi:hypothetical protein
MAVGEITHTTPLRDAAVEVGIVDPAFNPKEFVAHEHEPHDHPHDHKHTHPPGEAHVHADHVHADHTHPGLDSIPDNHGALH